MPRIRGSARKRSGVNQSFERCVPKPVNVELDLMDVAVGAPIVHMRGSRVFTDVFAADVRASVGGDVSGYGSALDQGVDILQCDRPDLALGLLRMRGLR